MPVMDEFKEERERIKTAPLGEKINYYVYYYKFHAIASVAIVVGIISLIYTIATNHETVFYATIINAYENESVSESYEQGFSEYVGISQDEYTFTFDSSMYLDYENQDTTFSTYLQKLVTLMAAGEIDVIVSDEDVFNQMYGNEMFMDLSTYLTEEELEQYAGDLYYIDYAVVEAYTIASDNMDYDYVMPEYDHRDYESMEDPVAVGIYIDSDNEFLDCYSFGDSEAIISVVTSTQSAYTALEYIKYVMQ